MSTPSPLSVSVLRQFRIIFSSVRQHFDSVERETGLSGALLWAMAQVAERPGIKVSELARALTIHPLTASNLVEKLVQKKMLQRERGDTDQRVVRLHLSERGLDIVARAPKPLRGVLPDALDRLSDETLQALALELQKLMVAMQITDDKAKDTPLADL